MDTLYTDSGICPIEGIKLMFIPEYLNGLATREIQVIESLRSQLEKPVERGQTADISYYDDFSYVPYLDTILSQGGIS